MIDVFFALVAYIKYRKDLPFQKVFSCHPRYFSVQVKSIILTW